jgi:hypothetical protein
MRSTLIGSSLFPALTRVELTEEGMRTTAAIAARIQPGLAKRLGRLDQHRIEVLLASFETLNVDPGSHTHPD